LRLCRRFAASLAREFKPRASPWATALTPHRGVGQQPRKRWVFVFMYVTAPAGAVDVKHLSPLRGEMNLGGNHTRARDRLRAADHSFGRPVVVLADVFEELGSGTPSKNLGSKGRPPLWSYFAVSGTADLLCPG